MGGARALERPQVCVGQVGAPTEHTSLPGNHLEWVQWRWGSSGLGAGQQLRPAACTLAPQPWGGPWIQNAQRFCGLSASRWGWGKHGWATSLLGKQKACKGQPGCVCFSPGQETSVGLHHSLTAGVRLLGHWRKQGVTTKSPQVGAGPWLWMQSVLMPIKCTTGQVHLAVPLAGDSPAPGSACGFEDGHRPQQLHSPTEI
ncbi:uncharacterized protein LOC128587318 isoform X2 [Nycticebus coucang]|uniref:uncharacterized protein LOC128587318 isoform X2 n=1 Tax=Nycticebus coucang TaxID=9470 RepID=UPI00234E2FB9|nr:uncharacterized protein LOC128587318 isoform X2 [Nycticebus coucang]